MSRDLSRMDKIDVFIRMEAGLGMLALVSCSNLMEKLYFYLGTRILAIKKVFIILKECFLSFSKHLFSLHFSPNRSFFLLFVTFFPLRRSFFLSVVLLCRCRIWRSVAHKNKIDEKKNC